MFYTIYKITNNLNGKYYIGKHQTKDLNDGYMRSGKLIKLAIDKHGRSNFTKEILHVFDNESEMNAKEKELVVISEQSYNLCEGGKGGFGYINQNELWNYPKHAEIAKENRKIGTKNSQFGTMWITDGTTNRKVKNLDSIPDGWYKGRVNVR